MTLRTYAGFLWIILVYSPLILTGFIKIRAKTPLCLVDTTNSRVG